MGANASFVKKSGGCRFNNNVLVKTNITGEVKEKMLYYNIITSMTQEARVF